MQLIFKGAIPSNAVEERFQELSICPALVLDDFKPDYLRDWGAYLFERLISARYRDQRVTLLISNVDLPGIPERIRSRFADPEIGRIVLNSATDYRLRVAAVGELGLPK